MDNPEDYLLTEVAPPILSRKRKFRRSMTGGSLEESRTELLALKRIRKVSPATHIHVGCMLDAYADLETERIGSQQHYRKQSLIIKQEAILESRLATDEKYAVLLVQFRNLQADSLRLRYGDYHKGNVSCLRARSQHMARQNKHTDVLAKMNWYEVLGHLKAEKQQMKEYEGYMNIRWHNNMLGCPNETEEDEAPETPITKLIDELSKSCNMEINHVMFEIQEYTKRNDVAHSGIDDFIAKDDWLDVANIIVRDTESIESGVLGPNKVYQARMMESLKTFSDRYFAKIVTKTEPGTGRKIVTHFFFSKEELERQAVLEATKAADETQRMKRRECEELSKAAHSSKYVGYSLKKAQKEVLEAEFDMIKKNEIAREAQTESGKATKDYKDALYRLRKLLKKGVDEG